MTANVNQREIGVGMEVRLLSLGARGFFSPLRDSPSQLRRSILSPPTRKKPLAPRVIVNTCQALQIMTSTYLCHQICPSDLMSQLTLSPDSPCAVANHWKPLEKFFFRQITPQNKPYYFNEKNFLVLDAL